MHILYETFQMFTRISDNRTPVIRLCPMEMKGKMHPITFQQYSCLNRISIMKTPIYMPMRTREISHSPTPE